MHISNNSIVHKTNITKEQQPEKRYLLPRGVSRARQHAALSQPGKMALWEKKRQQEEQEA